MHHRDPRTASVQVLQISGDLVGRGARCQHDEQVARNGNGLCAKWSGPYKEQAKKEQV